MTPATTSNTARSPAEVYRRGYCSSGRRWGLYRSDIVDPTGAPYMRRWILAFAGWMVRLHHIQKADAGRCPHDHPFDFVSVVLRGGYREERVVVSASGDTATTWETRRAPGVAYRRAEDLHRLVSVEPGTWTLVLTGPIRRTWGFLLPDGRWVDFLTYMRENE